MRNRKSIRKWLYLYLALALAVSSVSVSIYAAPVEQNVEYSGQGEEFPTLKNIEEIDREKNIEEIDREKSIEEIDRQKAETPAAPAAPADPTAPAGPTVSAAPADPTAPAAPAAPANAEKEEEGTESVGEDPEAETEEEFKPEKYDNACMQELVDTYIVPRYAMGEKWAVGILDVGSGTYYGCEDTESMQSASVIKAFIMGAVYDRVIEPENEKTAIACDMPREELDSVLKAMITVSDNTAANTCIDILGAGDTKKASKVIDEFCEKYGYKGVHLGRKFLESNPTDDNYVSAKACCELLVDIYKGECVSEKASDEMLNLLKGQQSTYKIPKGLPAGFTSGNKTGEMPQGYNLGCIENDIAIIMSPNYTYALAVLSNDLNGNNDEADSHITAISSFVAEHLDDLFKKE